MNMALKFRCPNCNEYIYLQFLKVGDIAACKKCKQKNVVPEDAETITDDEASRNLQDSKNKTEQSEISTQNTYKELEVETVISGESSKVKNLAFVNGLVVVDGKEYQLASRRRRYLAVVLNELFILFYALAYVFQAFIETIFRRKGYIVSSGLIGLTFISAAAILDYTGIIDSSFDRNISNLFFAILFISWFFGGVGIISIVLLVLVTVTSFYPTFFISLFIFGTFLGGDGALKGQGWVKKSCKIKIIHSQTGIPCTFWQAVLRRLFIYIPPIGFIDILCALGKKKQRLGDIIAKTIVVKQEKNETDLDDRPAYKTLRYFALIIIIMYSLNLILRYALPETFDGHNEIIGVNSQQTIDSSDRQFQLTIPSHWTEMVDLNDDAVFQVGYNWDELYVIVLVEKKDELNNMNLEKYSEVTRQSIISMFESDETSRLINVSGPIELTICDNRALQYKIQGVHEGVGLIYFHTSAENLQYYIQINGYTSLSGFSDEKNATLQEVIQSLRNLQ